MQSTDRVLSTRKLQTRLKEISPLKSPTNRKINLRCSPLFGHSVRTCWGRCRRRRPDLGCRRGGCRRSRQGQRGQGVSGYGGNEVLGLEESVNEGRNVRCDVELLRLHLYRFYLLPFRSIVKKFLNKRNTFQYIHHFRGQILTRNKRKL